MTEALWSTGDDEVSDVVGARVLSGIQMIYVSRLSAHPVPMVSGGLVTIAGQGPKDSNGAGKSSFIAAISLLSGDEQWRWSSGASDAADLLFTAEIAAQDGQWGNADHGYVIGVFTDPAATTPDDLGASALTVWLRINRRAPYIDVRWQQGLYVPARDSDSDRVAAADPMWAAMARRNGRHDIHANRLNQSLYGPHVRCVSFLSTSVRASATANLLAQPLNELSPERIFDAIAALTGIDRELEVEQRSRTAVHEKRDAEKRARDELERWEQQITAVEDGIQQRASARARLEAARSLWRSRNARLVIDGRDRLAEITEQLRTLETAWQERDSLIVQLKRELSDLQNDAAFNESCVATERTWKNVSAQHEKLKIALGTCNGRIEDLTQQRAARLEAARAADGRTREQADTEHATARKAVEDAVGTLTLRQKDLKDAMARLDEAETGNDVAGEQLSRLRAAGIHAAALLDCVVLPPDQRPFWEPRLVPYRNAIVVPGTETDLTRARQMLEDMPGTMLIPAAPAPTAPTVDLPAAADEALPLGRFLGTLAERGTAQTEVVDNATGLVVIGGFSVPLTGRAARIEQARAAVERASEPVSKAEEALKTARRALQAAEARFQAVSAAEEATEMWGRIESLRSTADELGEQIETLAPTMETARTAYTQMLATRERRTRELDDGRRRVNELNGLQETNVQQRGDLTDEQTMIDMQARIQAFGGTIEHANVHLLALASEQATWTSDEWTLESCAVLDTALDGCFPRGMPTEQIPREIAELRRDPRWSRGATPARGQVFQPLCRALRTYLSQTEQEDVYQQQQIRLQRESRTADLAAADKALREEALADSVHRSQVAAGIKDKLRKVSDQFDRLDRAYGGYGAGLDYPEPEPPAEPDRPWRWRVTPRWRRAEGQRLSPYDLRGNTAQMDEKAVKLVCAAALAGAKDRPLLLILDELGRNLGKQHRHEAVALFEQIGRDRNITVIGALQDDMERYAADASGLYIKLRRRSDAHPYNESPIVIGHDDNVERITLLQNWLMGYYGAPGVGPEADLGTTASTGEDLAEELEFDVAE